MTDPTPTDRDGLLHGVFDMPEHTYLTDPVPGGSLSASGAKLILKAPAKFHHRQTTGASEPKKAFDFGSAAHALVLGQQNVDIHQYDNWRTKEAREAQDASRTAKRTPILAKDWDIVKAMAAALRAHPIAQQLLKPGSGLAEQSLFWAADGIEKRARIDFLPNVVDGKRYVVPDYKTCVEDGGILKAIERAVNSYGYCQQVDWYTEAVMSVLGVTDVAFVLIFQEKTAPYLVHVVELSSEYLAIGADRNRRAVDLYKQCRESGVWPGYSDGVSRALAPSWLTFEHEADKAEWGWAS